MDDFEARLVSYINAAENARLILSQLKGIDLRAIDIQNALCEIDSIDANHATDLLNSNYTSPDIVQKLQNFNFKKFHPDVVFEWEEDEGIIPDGVSRLLTEQTAKVKGERWQVHKNDADPWPSNPHAHNYEAGLKMHLGTGDMFDSNKKYVGRIKVKKLKAIRKKIKNITLPKLETKKR